MEVEPAAPVGAAGAARAVVRPVTMLYNFAVTDLPPGSIFAGYRIEAVAGHGGMGVVYRATDLSLDRPVALKFIAVEFGHDQQFRRRFAEESRTAASLDHPNVIPIYQAGEQDGALFLAMRYVQGQDLRSEIAEHGSLAPDRVVGITAQIASALDAAHAAGLVHRDVKPANILLDLERSCLPHRLRADQALLAEADRTETGHLLGTLNYIAPEQIRGGTVGPRHGRLRAWLRPLPRALAGRRSR